MRNTLFGHSPYTGDVLAVFGIFDTAIAGKLIAFLSLLATALAIALACDHGAAASFAADASSSESERHGRDAVLDAFRVMFNPPSMKYKARRRRPPHLRRPHNHFRRHARNL